ncbi:hypothetical protein EV421DRAFT_1678950, partial [Armillaria borealis]
LIHNPEIKEGDNIIIYYTGHGSSYQCLDWGNKSISGNTGYIEVLCPIDRDTHDANKDTVPDISNRELNTIL